MLEGLYSALQQYAPPESNAASTRKVLRMVKNERMGGSVPVWETVPQPANSIEHSLTQALNAPEQNNSDIALAYNAEAGTISPAQNSAQEFGFGDLIDMINPLHHVPVVGHMYREFTGDEIKPIGNIIGGALFGGPLGAASGLINAIAIEETGKDITGNAMAFTFSGEVPSLRNSNTPAQLNDDPQSRLASVADSKSHQNLPGNLLAFTDLKARDDIVIERINAADGRTAGSFAKTSYPEIDENALLAREPITQVRFSAKRIEN